MLLGGKKEGTSQFLKADLFRKNSAYPAAGEGSPPNLDGHSIPENSAGLPGKGGVYHSDIQHDQCSRMNGADRPMPPQPRTSLTRSNLTETVLGPDHLTIRRFTVGFPFIEHLEAIGP